MGSFPHHRRHAINERIAVDLKSFEEPREKWFDVQTGSLTA
ncbi:MAG: hypothetical protein ABSE56_04575 [Bryobacteraceae bacterium]|jgi:hypothetical protein